MTAMTPEQSAHVRDWKAAIAFLLRESADLLTREVDEDLRELVDAKAAHRVADASAMLREHLESQGHVLLVGLDYPTHHGAVLSSFRRAKL